MEDFDLIIASFQSQYGIRLSRDLDGMKWDEFRAFLEGIAPETPLGRIVAIRSETDDDVLKHFSSDQRRIRSEWQSRTAQSRKPEETEDFLETLKNAFIEMAGGGTRRERLKQ